MIFKNRIWKVGNDKMHGYPFRFKVRYDKELKENVLVKLPFGFSRFSLEELEDMIAILKKVSKEKREDKI